MHTPDVEYIKEKISNFEEDWDEYVARCRSGKTEPRNIRRSAHELFLTSLVANVPRSKVWKFLDLLTDASVAHFVSSLNDGKTISVPLGDLRIETMGEATTAYMDTDTWLIAFYAAVVNRNQSAIKVLCSVPEKCFLGANIKPDDFDLAFVRACKGLYDPSVNIGQLLVDAMEASDEKRISEIRLNYAWNIILPVLSFFPFALEGDPDGEYADKFKEAIEDHCRYWQTEEKRYTWNGWRSLPLMAAAVLVFDSQGLKMPMDNDLVPRWIVEEFVETSERNKTKGLEINQYPKDGIVERALAAIQAADDDLIEGLRLEIQPSHINSIVRSWNANLPQEIKDRYVYLLMDQQDKRLDNLMTDGLASPDNTTRAYSVCALFKDFDKFNEMLTNGVIDPAKVKAMVKLWKSEGQNPFG